MADEKDSPADNVDSIWRDDLLGRRSEAEVLIGYLESASDRPGILSDGRAFTIAIDGSYGVGKTFFLRRLAKQLELSHPVAFVDAWGDDLSDEPLTALAATLKAAIEPLLKKPELRSKWASFMSKTGEVAKIAGAGLFRRGLSVLITGGAVDAASGVISSSSEAVKDAINDGLAEASQGVVDDAAQGLKRVPPQRVMEDRILEFEKGQSAIREMKASLAAIVSALTDQPLKAPICIVIDELDRCRPTYAIKVLEEIKHLFDVPGLVFIFGLHGDQLAVSISGAYGPGLDGKSYLRRFLNRRYALREPDLEPLVAVLFKESCLKAGQFMYPRVSPAHRQTSEIEPTRLIAEFMRAYALGARDAFELIDILQTCSALADPYPLHLEYLLGLIIGHIRNEPSGSLPPISRPFPWQFHAPDADGRFASNSVESHLAEFQRVVTLSRQAVVDAMNTQGGEIAERVIHSRERDSALSGISRPEHYPRLLSTVARFSNPRVDEAKKPPPAAP